MAAYAAVISLKHTINGLLNSSFSSREILESAHDEVKSLQQVLERLNGSGRSRNSMKRVDGLEGQIRDCANELEDFLELMNNEKMQEDEEEVRKEIASFCKTTKEVAKDYIQELSIEEDEEDEEEEVSDFGVEMVGHSSRFTIFRDRLLEKMRPVDLYYYSYWGEEGSGRTLEARAMYEDLSKSRGEYFDCWGWVSVKHRQLKQVLMSIISQVAVDGDDEFLISLSEDQLSEYLVKGLENRRYMIVLDDVDDAALVNYLKTTSLPDQSNGSLVFVITSSKDVRDLTCNYIRMNTPDRYFQECMWPILRGICFGCDSDYIPLQMEEAGKQIILNCRGRMVAAVKTMLFLLKTDKTVEQWSKIAADKENPIFMVEDEVSETCENKAKMQSLDTSDQGHRYFLQLFYEDTHDLDSVKKTIHPQRFFPKMQTISIWGMAGIGKTTFTKKLFRDESICHNFDHHVWITLGPKYQTQDILIDILSQIYPAIDKQCMKGDDTLTKDLCVQVSNKKCLIVLDDLYSQSVLHHLKDVFPDIKGTTLLTTRLAKVAKLGTRNDSSMQMKFLSREESWCLLCQKVFARESCPPELEKAGREIADKCDGLPLLILTVADQLLKVEQSEEYWMNVASGKEKSVFKNAHDQISKALLPSYQGLPQHLKPCFLYLGVFCEKYGILISDLTNLWISDGFLEPNSQSTEEIFVVECLSWLADISLVMVRIDMFGSQIKMCRLHSIFWHLCNSQAVENKFFHAINSYGDCITESMESPRRLCIRNNILLGMKQVQKSMASHTRVHSFLCVAPRHEFPVPLNVDLRLLRVMDAVSIRLYEFPEEVVKLVHLRYLGLTCNGKLPASISSLWKLEYLIVERYMKIKSSQNSSHLPEEIWDMKELKHLQVKGGHLPNRKSGPGLRKLITLLDVSAESCRKKVLKWIPNLKRLGIRIELAPGDVAHSFHCLNRISRLRRLESLECVVVNPQFRSEDAPPPPPYSMFPRSLKKLSLSGLGYPWKYMPIIGKLENLEMLKLKCYAFQGPEWEVDGTSSFTKLKFLLLQSTDLVRWKTTLAATMVLDSLNIRHCYRLQELPVTAPIGRTTTIKIVDCNPLVETWAELLDTLGNPDPQISRSWIADVKQE